MNNIQTPYFGKKTKLFGVTFRSKLEAEWAAFFTLAGIRWVYEYCTIETNNGQYTPDFIIDIDGGMICEIKPFDFDEENRKLTEQKLKAACLNLNKRATILRGAPDFCVNNFSKSIGDWHHIFWPNPDYENECHWDDNYTFCVCPYCWKIGFQHMGKGSRICVDDLCANQFKEILPQESKKFDVQSDKNKSFDHPRISYAAKYAKLIVETESVDG